jgi:hypothetical protein
MCFYFTLPTNFAIRERIQNAIENSQTKSIPLAYVCMTDYFPDLVQQKMAGVNLSLIKNKL